MWGPQAKTYVMDKRPKMFVAIEHHIGKDKVMVRFRRDGSLAKYVEIPASFRNAIVARLKIMCDLDIAEKRKP